jgi:hypothetical protein
VRAGGPGWKLSRGVGTPSADSSLIVLLGRVSFWPCWVTRRAAGELVEVVVITWP